MYGAQEQIESPESLAAAVSESNGGPAFSEIWKRPLPGFNGKRKARFCCRAILIAFGRRIHRIIGLENIYPRHDPFILALNHSTRYEALAIPAALAFYRNGRMVHFFADWNFLMVPVLGSVIRWNEPVVVTRKSARPRVLNRLRPFFTDSLPTMAHGRRLLDGGSSVGIFPEGTVNRDPDHLMRGDHGAALLSLTAGVPVVPAGVRFPRQDKSGRVRELSRMELEFGRPMWPGASLARRRSELPAVKEWHEQIMREISRLSRKNWNPQLLRKKHVHH